MKTFVIAEAGINHDGDLQRAKNLVEAAKECGCSAVKFQTYKTELRVQKDNPAYYTLQRCELDNEQQTQLKKHADDVGIEFLSTPFDAGAVDFLINDLGLRRIKLASFDVTNTKFLDIINKYGKQYSDLNVIMSCGMASSYDILSAIGILEDVFCLTLLHCISSYPTPDLQVNLSSINSLRDFACNVGYSDHTDGIIIPAMAVLVGATVVEKHFTLSLDGPGVDNPVSADPKMMKEMIDIIKRYEKILGDGNLEICDIEKAAMVFRRVS